MTPSTFTGPTVRSRKVLVALEALGLTVASVVVPVALVLGSQLPLNASGVTVSDAGVILLNKRLQLGFLLVAVGYVAVRGNRSRYVTFGRPTGRDLGWVLAVVAALAVAGRIGTPALAALGFAPPDAAGAGVGLATRPALWPIAFVVWFLIAAPAEELLFRGVIQGRLREAFDARAGVILAAALFALMHVPWPLMSGGGTNAVVHAVVETFAAGLAFGLAYERTDNLVVPSLAHALLWSQLVIAHAVSILAGSLPGL